MTLHPSLKRAEKMGASRSVMKRSERIKWLIKKGLWKEENKPLGLPKIKVVKLKSAKKEKPKDMYDDIPKVHMPEPMQID